MTIDEAITQAREKAKEIRENIIDGDNLEPYESYCNTMVAKSAEEYKQIAEWLEELKSYRASVFSGYMTQKMLKEEYNKAIDDLIAECENAKFAESDEISLSDVHTGVNSGLSMAIHFAEQLNVGGKNERSI